MNPDALRRLLAELRERGAGLRSLPRHRRLDALGGVLERFAAPDSACRRELEQRLPKATGFSAETVRAGLATALAGWNTAALHELAGRELDPLEDGATCVSGFETTGLFLAGAIPMPSLLSMLAPLALGSPVLAKCASRDPLTPHLVARALGEADPALEGCAAAVGFAGDDRGCVDALLEAECVVVTGSDATVAAVRGRAPASCRLVPYGHRVSLAAVGREALSPSRVDEVARRIATDAALWDQLGCLSPIAVFAESEAGADALSEALASAFGALERRMPRGEVEDAAAAFLAHERAEAELRAAAGTRVRLLSGSDAAWTVVREDGLAPRPAPLHRFLRVHPLAGAADLTEGVSPYRRHLAAVAVEGFGSGDAALARSLVRLGASRVCAPGALQAPPLSWPRDGRPVLLPLARFSRSEPAG